VIGDPGDRLGIGFGGAEVIGSGVVGCLRSVGSEQFFREGEVAVEGLQDVLPGTDCVGVADENGGVGEEAADEVRDETFDGPVSATDDVAGAGSGDGDFMLDKFGGVEVALAKGGGGDLGAGLGTGVGVVAAEWVGLFVGAEGLPVVVALVSGNDDDGTDGWGAADAVEDAGGADDVGLVSGDGIVAGDADGRLGSEVEDDLGGEVLEGAVEGCGVADVSAEVFDSFGRRAASKKLGVVLGSRA
jgi:hypothetical protein